MAREPNEKRVPRRNELPVDELARDYVALAAKARSGDVEAAYRLYEGTSSCAEAPGDAGDLAGRLADIERGTADESERAREQTFAKTQYERCAPLSAGQRRAWRDWLKLAASLGNIDAQLIYVNAGVPQKANTGQYWKDVEEYRDIAKRYLDARIASGNPKALLAAAATYDGFNNTVLNQPDPIRRYAYLYAYTLAMGGEDNTFVDSLAEGQEVLGPAEIAQAQRLGEEIFGQCCKH